MRNFQSLFFFYILILPLCVFGQRLAGNVRSAQTKIGIKEAIISVKVGENTKVTHPDSLGNFLISDLSFGRYDVEIRCLGYQSSLQSQVLVVRGKDTYLEILLQELPKDLEVVEVKSSRSDVKGIVSNHRLNMQQSTRYAATWGDPARMALSLPGVTTVNDNSNQLVVRGNSPAGVLWRVDGVEIPNPNHFSSDGASGGTIGVLSPQILGNSSFLTGAFPAQFGNALSAVYDISLRAGSILRREHHFQANVLGFEIGSEGYFKKGKNSSYLFHVRTANPVMVNRLGFSSIFNSAQPKFRDLVFKVQGGSAKKRFSVWGIGGQNSLDFSLDSFADLNNTSHMWATGAKYEAFVSSAVQWRTILSASSLSHKNSQKSIGGTSSESKFSDLNQANLRWVSEIDWWLSPHHRIESGFILSKLGYDLTSSLSFTFPNLGLVYEDTQLNGQGSTYLGQFFVQTEQKIQSFTFRYGLHAQYFFLNDHSRIDPRFQVSYQSTPRSQWFLGLGQHSRLDPISVYLYKNTVLLNGKEVDNQRLSPPRARHVVVGFQRTVPQGIDVKTEVYYQNLDQVAIQDTTILSTQGSIVSLLNEINSINLYPLVNAGEGRNYGWEISIEKKLRDGFYGLFTSSLFRSEFRNSRNSNFLPTRFDNRFILNGLIGKEWVIGKQLIDVNIRGTWTGGIRRMPSSIINGQVSFTENLGYAEKLANYFRVDAKVNYVLDLGKTTSTFSLDINNVFDRFNPLAKVFNPVTKEFVLIPQLGLLPVLSYTLQF